MLNLVIRDTMNIFLKFMPVSIVAGLFFTASCRSIRKYMEKRFPKINLPIRGEVRKSNRILGPVFCIYCFLIIDITLLSREPGSRDAVRLQLFGIFSKHIWGRVFAIENILMFIPFGFMLPLIWGKGYSFKWCIFAGFLSSSAIEVIQYFTKRGYFELDDILNNVIGTMIGVVALVAVKKIMCKVNSECKYSTKNL